MERWIVQTFSTNEIVLLGVGGMVALSLAAVVLVRRLFPRLADGEFESAAGSVRVVYELIFALILAFVIGAVLDVRDEAETTVAAEATAISDLVRGNQALPSEHEQRVQAAVEQYVRTVANHEWQTMQSGEESPQAQAALEGMYAEYFDVQPQASAEADHYKAALEALDTVASKRRERLDIAAGELPTMLRILVVVGLLLLLVFEYRPRLSRVAGLVVMGSLAAVVTSAVLLTVVLKYPFVGEGGVRNAPLKQDTLKQFWTDELTYHRRPGDAQRPLTSRDLEGVWSSQAYGTIVMRCYDARVGRTKLSCGREDDRMRGVYRYQKGIVSGRVVGGVFKGWWSEAPTRRAPSFAGTVEWRLIETSDRQILSGRWGYGRSSALQPGWDLEPVGGPEPPDLARRFARTQVFRDGP